RQGLTKVLSESFGRKSQRRSAQVIVIEADRVRLSQSRREPARPGLLVKHSVFSRIDDVEDPSSRQRDNRSSARERFDSGNSEILLSGLNEGGARTVEVT